MNILTDNITLLKNKMVRISLNVKEQKREKIEIVSDSYQIPFLEGLTKKTIIAGRNRVNLYYLNCSCKIYRLNVKKYPRRDLRRICNHLYTKLFSEAENNLDELSKLMLHNQFWFSQTDVRRIKFYKDILYTGFHKDHNIISLFRDQDGWEKFVFEITNNNWRNGLSPLYKENKLNELEKLIAELNNDFLQSLKS